MTTTKTSGSTSSINATATSSKRMSGLVSGLDTDTLVKQLTSGTQSKINKQMQNKQIALWRQQSYREVTKALTEFKSKYFSSSNSSNSILSSDFFNSTSIKNTSTFLNVSGLSSVAKNMVVNKISQLAKQASFSSSHKVSNGKITSGAIRSTWTPNTISGASVKINYNGKDYAVNVDSNLSYDTTDNISTVTDALNKSISKIDGLSGNISFSIGTSGEDAGKVLLSTTGGNTATVKITDGTANLLSGLGLTKGTTVSTTTDAGSVVEATMKGDPNTADFFKNTISAGSNLDVKIGDTTYSLKIASTVNLFDENKTPVSILRDALTNAISSNTDLKDKLSVTVDDSGNVSFAAKDGTSPVAITGGSQNMLQGLGLVHDNGDGSVSYTTSGTFNQANVVKSYLQDSLVGSTLSFSLNGLTKSITFDETAKDSYSTPEGLVNYLNTKLKTAYGSFSDDPAVNPNGYGKVNVKLEDDGSMSMFIINSLNADGTVQSVQGTDVLTVSSSDKTGVLGANGALRIYAGESNRINTNKTLEDVSADLSTPLSTAAADGSYKINVNGKDFTFKNTDTVSSIMSTINNDSDANVTLTYSNTTNTFSVTAKDGGANSKVSISDVSGFGNLASSLFGVSGTDYTATSGQDAKITISFDGGVSSQEITRSSNNFTLDGVNFELLGSNVKYDADNNPIAPDPIKFSVENKTDDLITKIKDFVTDYNNIIKLTNDKVTEKKPTDGIYLPLTDDQKADMSETQITNWETQAKKGLLLNDSILNSLDTDMRLAMTDQVSSIKSALYEMGISSTSYKDNGALTIDEGKLKQALIDDPDKISQLFTSSDGIASKLQKVIDKNVNASVVDPGILVQKAGSDTATVDQSTLANNIKEYNTQITNLKTLLETQQEQYYNKFTKLEQYLSQMNSQMSWFSSNSSSS